MSVRTDITFRPDLSPRLIIVDFPSTELVLQDLHDTVCAWQDAPPNHDYDIIIASAGKEALGGGVSVGITTTLQNAQVMFEARVTVASAGTVTTPDTNGVALIDSAGDFTTTAKRGDLVLNNTDGSKATVLEIVSDTELRTNGLSGGSDNQWGSADSYEVFEVEQCSISGGNLVAVDDVGADISSSIASFGTQIVRTASSSATLQSQAQLEFATFNGGVTYDAVNGTAGTAYPIGTPGAPASVLADALAILAARGLRTLYVNGDATIDSGLDYTGLQIVGESMTKSAITVSAAAVVNDAEFSDATVTGTLDGGAKLEGCRITSLAFVDGFIESCVIVGPITLSGAAPAHFLDCWSGVTGGTKPVIDLGGSGSELSLRNYNGEVRLENKTGTDRVEIDLNSGVVELHTNVTVSAQDEIEIRGIGAIVNNAVNPNNVKTEDLISGRDLTVQTEKIGRRVESLRPNHQALGTDFYVDPVNGSDSNDGRLPTEAFLTLAKAMTAVTSGANDVVWIENRSGGPATFTERLNITKNRVLIRGPGLNTSLVNPDDTDSGVIIDGGGVSISGLRITAAAGAARAAIRGTGKPHTRLEHLQIVAPTGEGISLPGGDAHTIHNVIIEDASDHGIHLQDTTDAVITRCTIQRNTGAGIHLAASGPSLHISTQIGEECTIHGNGAAGLQIDANVEGTVLHASTHIRGTTQRVLDNGINTHDETSERADDVVHPLRAAVEYQRGAHTAEFYLYVDATNGSDSNAGTSTRFPKATIGSALAAVTKEHTAIIVLASGANQQVFTENLNVTTRFTFIRGPGLDCKIVGASDLSPTIALAAEGCSVEGFEVGTPATGTPNAISVTADFCRVRRVRINAPRAHGISCVSADRLRVEEVIIESAGQAGTGNGIRLDNSSFALVNHETIVDGSANDNVVVTGTAANDNVFNNITSVNAGGFGVSIGANATATRIADVALTGNTSGDVSDAGTGTAVYSTVLDAYEGKVFIDTVNGVAGKSFPVGTRSSPVSNTADAKIIADGINTKEFVLLSGSVTLGQNFPQWSFTGLVEATVDVGGRNVNGSTFRNVVVTGAIVGDIDVYDGAVENATGFKGTARRVGLRGTVGLASGTSYFHQCFARQQGGGTPTIDFVGGGRDADVAGWDGDLQIANMTTAGNDCVVDLDSGHVTIAASCTAGTVTLRGTGDYTDSSAGATVDATELARGKLGLEVWQRLGLDPGNAMATSATQITVGGITINVSEVAGVVTLTRV